ncbi:alanine racemase [Patulibacter minatonensis]|uniref:alanine racemase n=1 Tax=Patulibacter minatonensis TaxID=298163 RepID=UPI0004B1BC7A|nr:alanine racemase [Patulibacter minatonensis]
MRVVARINVAAIERNVTRLLGRVGPGTAICAVVKADGYGHGAVPAARAAVAGGATWLAVVTAAEATALRDGGIDARLLVLGPLRDDDLPEALDAGAEVVVWDAEGVERLERLGRPADVHVKLDSGMGRLGQRDADEALALCDRVAAAAHLRLSGAMTHFATADAPDDLYADQLARFTAWAADVRRRHPSAVLHAANSAALLRDPASHFDLVRPGIAIYGLDPMNHDAADHDLEPALEWHTRLAAVKPLLPGESVGYGRRFRAAEETTVGTASAGYADGVRRALTNTGTALVGGRRRPITGTVSMDSIGIDLGPGATDRAGDRVVLVGRDGDEHLSAEEVARTLGTINYEITCGIGPRVPRVHHRDGAPVPAAGPPVDRAARSGGTTAR